MTSSITNTSEVHTLNIYVDNEKYLFNFTVDDTAIISTVSNPIKTNVNGEEEITLSHDRSKIAMTWAWNSASYTALPKI